MIRRTLNVVAAIGGLIAFLVAQALSNDIRRWATDFDYEDPSAPWKFLAVLVLYGVTAAAAYWLAVSFWRWLKSDNG